MVISQIKLHYFRVIYPNVTAEVAMTKIGYTRVSSTDQTTERQELGDIKVLVLKLCSQPIDTI